ncbi:MAG: glycosyltransferase family protein [Betaproteobacteria bacterium]|nr:glycosyltransferase family protein [Betaproteobacteria bacterium]
MIAKAIIEARMTSTRLPGKVVMPILGRPTLELLIERLQRAQCLDGIVVATTTNATDDVLEALAAKLGVECFRGSEDDVLSRVLGAAQASNTELIVEITGDCPLVDPAIVDQLIGIYRANSYDYVSNTLKRTYPRGLDVQVFSASTLGEVARLTDDPVDHEHVSLYIYEHPERFRLYNLESGLSEKYWDLRLTVDTPEDFALIRDIYERLYPVNPTFAMKDVLLLLDQQPDLLDLNRHIRQKAVR